ERGQQREDKLDNPWVMQSKRREKSGLVNFGLRFYDAKVGGFINPDPKGLADIPNPYAYMYNNPRSGCDVYGLDPQDWNDIKLKHPEETFGPMTEEQTRAMNQVNQMLYENNNRNRPKTFGLPTDYTNDFDKIPEGQAYYMPNLNDTESRCSSIGIREVKGAYVMCINGIRCSYVDSLTNAMSIFAKGNGINVDFIYNATYGGVEDVCESADNLSRIATKPSALLMYKWVLKLQDTSWNSNILQFGHSQGVLMIRNALRMSPDWVRKRVSVVSIAGAGTISESICHSVDHYERFGDIVPGFDTLGRLRNSHTITRVPRHPDAPRWGDHAFTSPSYANVIKRSLDSYLNKYEPKL
ncbi:MAG: hypothetical protein P0S95_05955, partial [Rhabdochlamydiaceae bacterium]|nr:hypothetical protein [Candidatus Amphrikana amoebophyrae]